MDKETLSNYGWIVICVMVLAVMIALATPFGTFVADAVKSTTQGLFDVNQNALNSTGLINIGDQSFGEGGNGGQGGTGDQGGTGLPAVGTSAEDCTWDEIKAISEAGKGDEYFNLGDKKTFTTTDGKEIVMEIVAFNADTKADGTGTAGITWISKGIVATRTMTNEVVGDDSWTNCDMHDWYVGSFYGTLPADVKNVIEKVNKTYSYKENDNEITLSCTEDIWIPSTREIFGADRGYENAGPEYTDYFTSDAVRVKYDNNGGPINWWLRSGHYDGGYFCYVYHQGYRAHENGWGSTSAHQFGIVLGFCT